MHRLRADGNPRHRSPVSSTWIYSAGNLAAANVGSISLFAGPSNVVDEFGVEEGGVLGLNLVAFRPHFPQEYATMHESNNSTIALQADKKPV